VDLRFLEVRCSDEQEHRRRLQTRRRAIEGMPGPTWESVQERRDALEEWADERLIVDSMDARADNLRAALATLGRLTG
jgi:hypothetical protein